MRRHMLIPDTQVRPGVDTSHIDWAARAIVEYMPDVIVHIGDNADMPSLSSHAGQLDKEGARIQNDFDVANDAMARLFAPQEAESKRRRDKHRTRWEPERHALHGNHEYRIVRAVQENPQLEGIVSLDKLQYPAGVVVHPFLEIVDIDGICYSHYFQNSHSGRPIGGSIDNRLNRIGRSFVQGHEQGLIHGRRQFPGELARCGLVAGSFYLHDEGYRGAQGNGEWRGIIIFNEVKDGDYDLMTLSMDYLRRKFS